MKTLNNSNIKTILVVDDEDSLAMFIKKLLMLKGYNVLIVSNGFEAVKAYKSNQTQIDLVLMDISMPVMGGLEAHDEIKKYDPCAPILLMSAYSKETFEDLGASNFIRKPIHPDVLINTIEEVIRESASSFGKTWIIPGQQPVIDTKVQCSCGDTHKGHICFLANMGLHSEVYHLTRNPTAICTRCNAKANQPHNVCYPAHIAN